MQKHGDTKEVAAICECSIRHVQSTWKKYQEGGIKAILAVKMGSPVGKNRKLTTAQEERIKKLITEKVPCELELRGYLWDGIEMPLTTVGDYLARWNFTYQRPKKKITGKMPKL